MRTFPLRLLQFKLHTSIYVLTIQVRPNINALLFTICKLGTLKHAQLWPDICSALVKCHPEIKTSDELSTRLVPHFGINMYDDSNTIEITYSIEGDPEFRGYFVTLRDWEIAEVCMAK